MNSQIDIRAIRLRAGGTQESFSEALKIPLATLQNWEQGRRPVSGAALALFRLIDTDPVKSIEALKRINNSAGGV